ncbi:MAG: HAD family phosphatase [Chlamydiales bacterium]|nr:HAD family phosphatase [Chlamydiales bacterium]
MSLLDAKAVIFDMDGVLVDTMELHRVSWEKLAKKLGKPFSNELFMQGNGLPGIAHAFLYRWTTSHDEAISYVEQKEAIFLETTLIEGIRPMPGVNDFLEVLSARNIPCAVGTSAPRDNMHSTLKAAGLDSFFKAFVSVEDVTKGKPDPEVFLRAAEKLGMAPEDCVVIEDAFLGVEAAKAGGIYTIAITHTHTREELKHADLIVGSFAELVKLL